MGHFDQKLIQVPEEPVRVAELRNVKNPISEQIAAMRGNQSHAHNLIRSLDGPARGPGTVRGGVANVLNGVRPDGPFYVLGVAAFFCSASAIFWTLAP